jgi:hypothetical protein
MHAHRKRWQRERTRVAGVDRVEFGERRGIAYLVTKLVNNTRFLKAA